MRKYFILLKNFGRALYLERTHNAKASTDTYILYVGLLVSEVIGEDEAVGRGRVVPLDEHRARLVLYQCDVYRRGVDCVGGGCRKNAKQMCRIPTCSAGN